MSCNMLRHLHLSRYADTIQRGVEGVIQEGKIRTPDVGGYNSTTEFVTAVLNKIELSRNQQQ